MYYDTVIFDLDGTLLNTLPDLSDGVNYALAEFNMPLRTEDEVRRFVGNGMALLIQRAVPAGTDESLTAAVLERFKEYYAGHCDIKTRAYSGVTELLERLKAEGYRLAVVSNKAHEATSAIVEKYFPGVFDMVFGERRGVPRKPCPDAVLEVTESLGARRTLYVGDSDVDVQTAENAGLDFVAVTWGFRDRVSLEKAGARVFAETAEELFRIAVSGTVSR